MNITKIVALVILTNSVGISLAGCADKELERKCDNISELISKERKRIEDKSRNLSASDYIGTTQPIKYDELNKLEKKYSAECMSK